MDVTACSPGAWYPFSDPKVEEVGLFILSFMSSYWTLVRCCISVADTMNWSVQEKLMAIFVTLIETEIERETTEMPTEWERKTSNLMVWNIRINTRCSCECFFTVSFRSVPQFFTFISLWCFFDFPAHFTLLQSLAWKSPCPLERVGEVETRRESWWNHRSGYSIRGIVIRSGDEEYLAWPVYGCYQLNLGTSLLNPSGTTVYLWLRRFQSIVNWLSTKLEYLANLRSGLLEGER